ncbi:hypothetical protein L1987_31106 [Smallanthus sonchifolius]|uniref:Uncharacterized protein n=1 Tax=Smallanthus sonchifolius TaxID=185202 RepID=A0ACB9I420_9ASTR|nr:hypothetical protein L1987_31106 [Smallanthus sonchifolius]
MQDPACQENTLGQIVEWLRDTAKNIFDSEDKSMNYSVICAYSMYHITKTILRTYCKNSEDELSQQDLFDILSSMIADIIAACLTNLPQVITMKCHTSEIEKREDRIKDAAQLPGKTAQIIESPQDHDIPNMDPSDMPFIDKWRAP